MAFTFTTITSTLLDVASGTGTLSELYADAIAHTPGCMTNPSANVYQIEGNRELELSGTTILTIETGDTIQWDRTSHGNILEVQQNATIVFEAGSTMNQDASGDHMGYSYFYGRLDVQGTALSRVVWDNCGRNYIYPYGNGSQSNGGAHTVSYLTIQNLVNSSSYALYMSPGQTTLHDDVTHTFDNIISKGGPTEASGNGWLFYWGWGSFHNFKFTNIDMTNGNGWLIYGASNVHVDGGTALNGDTDSRVYGTPGAGNIASAYNPVNTKLFATQNSNQNKCLFKNYVFDDGDLGVYTFGTLDRGATVYLDSCTFQNATNVANLTRGILVLHNPTYTSISGSNFSYNGGTVLHARKMTLTVEDSLTNPIADATVVFRQKEGKETWECRTDANGQVLDAHGEPIWLIEKEETSNGTFSQWSDGTGDQVHVIEVYKDGFSVHTQEVAMTADKTITVTLETAPPGSTKIYGATLYGSNIY